MRISKYVFVFLLCSLPSWAALSVVNAGNGRSSGAGHTSQAVTTSFTIASGDAVWAWACEDTNITDAITVTDGSNTYNQYGGFANLTSTGRCGVFIALNVTSVSSTAVTANYSTGGGIQTPVIVIVEIGGAATSSATDGTLATSSNNSSVQTLTSGSLTTTNANDILIDCTHTKTASSALTAGTNFSIPTNGSSAGGGCETQIVSATQSSLTSTMTWTTTSVALSNFGAIKQAAAATCSNHLSLTGVGAGC